MSTPITGFFYIIGSKDIQFSYNENLNFGFNPPDNTPIFKYSMKTIYDHFGLPSSFTHFQENNTISNMVVEYTDYVEDFKIVRETNDPLIADLKVGSLTASSILSFIYNYDDIEDLFKNDDILYKNNCDKLLSQRFGRYREKSIRLYKSQFGNLSNRISRISFDVEIHINDTTSAYRTIDMYIIPDDMLFDRGMLEGKYAILRNSYRLINDIPTVTEISSEFLSIEKNRNYTAMREFKTTHVVYNPDYSSELYRYTRSFYIYSHIQQSYMVPDYKNIYVVKRMLEIEFNFDRKRLKLEYPDLFSDTDVDIFPMLKNINSEDRISTPISVEDIISELDSRGIPEGSLDSGSIETFILEGRGPYDRDHKMISSNNVFRIPLILVDRAIVSEKGHLSNRYSNMRLYATGMRSSNDKSDILTFYLKIFFKLLLKMYYNSTEFDAYNAIELTNILKIPHVFNLKVYKYNLFGTELINKLSFEYNNTTYTLHGYDYGAIHGTN